MNPKQTAVKPKQDDRSRFPCTAVPGDKSLYTSEDVRDLELGKPGHYPFVRGVHETMYQGKIWTMRMFSGFGTARDTNERFKFLLKQG